MVKIFGFLFPIIVSLSDKVLQAFRVVNRFGSLFKCLCLGFILKLFAKIVGLFPVSFVHGYCDRCSFHEIFSITITRIHFLNFISNGDCLFRIPDLKVSVSKLFQILQVFGNDLPNRFKTENNRLLHLEAFSCIHEHLMRGNIDNRFLNQLFRPFEGFLGIFFRLSPKHKRCCGNFAQKSRESLR